MEILHNVVQLLLLINGLKTKMALKNGVDLVIELPVLYSISSAENFADGSIKILDSLGIIDYLSFGAETSDIEILKEYCKYFI